MPSRILNTIIIADAPRNGSVRGWYFGRGPWSSLDRGQGLSATRTYNTMAKFRYADDETITLIVRRCDWAVRRPVGLIPLNWRSVSPANWPLRPFSSFWPVHIGRCEACRWLLPI
jgi:hypothetical protein